MRTTQQLKKIAQNHADVIRNSSDNEFDEYIGKQCFRFSEREMERFIHIAWNLRTHGVAGLH